MSESELEDLKKVPTLSQPPFRRRATLEKTSFEKASWLSKLTFSWMAPYVSKAYNTALTVDDLFINSTEQTEDILDDFAQKWENERTKPKPSLFKTLIRLYWRELAISAVLIMIYEGVLISLPLLMGQIIIYLNGPTEPLWRGALPATAFFVFPFIGTFCYQQQTNMLSRIGMKGRTAMAAYIYRKALRLSPTGRATTTVGQIVNLMSTDANKWFLSSAALHDLWSTLALLAMSVGLLCWLLGPIGLISLGSIVILGPLSFWLAWEQQKVRKAQLFVTDERIKTMNEVLQGIRVIKFGAMEDIFSEQVEAVREKEMKLIRKGSYLRAMGSIFSVGIPVLAGIMTLVSFQALVADGKSGGKGFTLEVIFPAIGFLSVLSAPLTAVPQSIFFYIQLFVALDRVQEFLELPELDPNTRIVDKEADEHYIRITDATFSWNLNVDKAKAAAASAAATNGTEPPVQLKIDSDAVEPVSTPTPARPLLSNVNIDIKPGSLVAVVGRCGSGKSSLVSAMLGEMERVAGKVHVGGRIAYVPQTAWIIQATFQENILFGKPYQAGHYAETIKASCLERDVTLLPGGHFTEIGEKGLNLSGGQRQRLSIARAVYSDADIYVFDDPLSAVDAHVTKDLFQGCIKGMLKDKTRVLVANQLHLLPEVDEIIVMKDGNVCEVGSYKELMAKKGELSVLMSSYGTEDDADAVGELEGTGEVYLAPGDAPKRRPSRSTSIALDEKFILNQMFQKTPSLAIAEADILFNNFGVVNNQRRSLIRRISSTMSANSVYSGVQPYGTGINRTYSVNSVYSGANYNMNHFESFDSPPSHPQRRNSSIVLSRSSSIVLSAPVLERRESMAMRPILTIEEATPTRSSSQSLENFEIPEDTVPEPDAAAFEKKDSVTIEQLVVVPVVEMPNADPTKRPKTAGTSLISAESSEDTGLNTANIFKYINISGGWSVIAILLITFVFAASSIIAFTVWLAEWVENYVPPGTWGWTFYAGIYGLIGALQIFFVLARNLIVAYGGLKACRSLHDGLFGRIMYAPCAFFDSTPLGRILNRFAKDTDQNDQVIPASIQTFLEVIFGACFSLGLCIYIIPWLAIPFAVIIIGYIGVQRYFSPSLRQTTSLEAVTKSPIYAHFNESLLGVPCLRAYENQARFEDILAERIDKNNGAAYVMYNTINWVSLRLDILGALISALVAGIGLIFKGPTPGTALLSVAISASLSVAGNLNIAVRTASDLESKMNSVDRVFEYMEVPQEPAHYNEKTKPDESWPQDGVVEFDQAVFRYRPELPPVLKGLSFKTAPHEKIGVVGRTGAGKSSIMQALFRFAELSEGRVVVDGVTLGDLGLHDLRSGLCIIPQEPILFSGTFRQNLDPYETKMDAEIWEAVGHVQLKGQITSLDDVVTEAGENISIGTRQLICMARAMLRKPRVLIMDEASANLDTETDEKIQRTVRVQFKNCTVLTIAHRLNTIIDSDRILVMDAGRCLEFDSPHNLLQRPDSVFASMVEETGPAASKALRRTAAKAAAEKAASAHL